MSQWIPTSERLPDPVSVAIVYVVTDDDAMTDLAEYTNNLEWVLMGMTQPAPADQITHWMPLPEGPEVQDAL